MTNSKILFTQNIHTEVLDNYNAKIYIAEEVFELLEKAYKSVKGGLHFRTSDELLLKTTTWRVIYDDIHIVGVIIYKAKKGLKMVAMGISDKLRSSFRKIVKETFVHIFKITFSTTWMELSEGAEKFIRQNGGEKYILPNHLAAKLTNKKILGLCDDGMHYKRVIKGVVKTKIIIGTAKNV